MFENIVPVTKDVYQNKKLKPIDSYAFAAKFNLSTVMLHEFARAGSFYPIVFIEDQQKVSFQPVALFAFETGQNLFVDEDGRWDALYIPAIFRRYPFALARTEEEDRFTVCVEAESEFLSDSEGKPLFLENGEPSEVLEHVKKYLGELYQMERITQRFCEVMKEKYMFTPLSMRIQDADTVKNISGAYMINEDRLNNLTDDEFLSFRHENFLQPIFSHLNSLGQIERLNQRK